MKKFVSTLMCIAMMSLAVGCADDMKDEKGFTYTSYGLINKDEVQHPSVQYKLCVGNLIWGSILVYTVVAPVYFFGFSLWEPVGLKPTTSVTPSAPTTLVPTK